MLGPGVRTMANAITKTPNTAAELITARSWHGGASPTQASSQIVVWPPAPPQRIAAAPFRSVEGALAAATGRRSRCGPNLGGRRHEPVPGPAVPVRLSARSGGPEPPGEARDRRG